MFIVALTVFLVIFFLILIFLLKKKVFWHEIVIVILYLLSLPFFLLALAMHDQQYYAPIDVVDQCYSPFGEKHIWSLVVYFALYHIALLSLWLGKKLAPLYAVLCLVFTFIGLILNAFILTQIIGHDTSSLGGYSKTFVDTDAVFFLPVIILNSIMGISLIVKMIKNEKQKSEQRIFKNKFLNSCNQFLSKRYSVSIWALIFLFPILIVITLILILLGQDYNSLVKVFTETTTWTFSQKMHPPPLDHTGHYLCTVSAKGTPKIVKPIRLGKRGGRTIIVNRQLQIANAFEELVYDVSPKLHHIIRSNYDKYGYHLCTKINTEKASNMTYVLMKPLEWFFLICLYLCVEKPEEKIKRQYKM